MEVKKKEEIRKRLNIGKYKGKEEEYNEENDHNPTILEKCSKCIGGKTCQEVESMAIMDICQECDGLGITGNLIKKFQNDNPTLTAKVNKEGWLICPNCNISFSTYSKNSWTGFRHKTCGQKIAIQQM